MASVTKIFTEQANTTNDIKSQVDLQGQPFTTFKLKQETITPKVQAVELTTKNITGDALIWDNATYCVLGTNKWASSLTYTSQVIKVIPPNNVFTEEFLGTRYEDTGSTTATWNTTTFQLTFTSGQLAQSSAVCANIGTITGATMSVAIDSGAFDLYLSADGGSNWESVTSGTAHSFTNTGTDLRFKIVENASSTGTITNIQISIII